MQVIEHLIVIQLQTQHVIVPTRVIQRQLPSLRAFVPRVLHIISLTENIKVILA